MKRACVGRVGRVVSSAAEREAALQVAARRSSDSAGGEEGRRGGGKKEEEVALGKACARGREWQRRRVRVGREVG